MKSVWSPDTALKAYIYTVQSCKNFKEPGVPELLSAMAAGWDAKLIVESWSRDSPITTSIGLAAASLHTNGRHVCIVSDEKSRADYLKSMQNAGMTMKTEVIVGEAAEVMAAPGMSEVDFVVVDCKRRDFVRVLRFAKLSHDGAVLVRKNAHQSSISGFKWQGVLERGTRVIRSELFPVGRGLDVVRVRSNGGNVMSMKKSAAPSRWIKYVDEKSGEEHVFRG